MSVKKNKFKLDLLILLVFSIGLILANYQTIDLPPVWDEATYILPASISFAEQGFNSGVTQEANGHPPLFFMLLGTLFSIFGKSLLVAHILILIFALISLYFTFKLGELLFRWEVGLLASILLFFHPYFLAQTGLVFLATAITALFTTSIYFFLKAKKINYMILSSFLVLTDLLASGLAIILFLYNLFEDYRKKINKKIRKKNILIYSVPLLVISTWLICNKIKYGVFLTAINHSDLVKTNFIEILLNSFYLIKLILFDNFNWILILVLILVFLFKIDKSKLKKRISISFLITLIIYIVFSLSKSIVLNYGKNFYPHIESYFNLFLPYQYIFFVFIFFFLMVIKDIFIESMKKDTRLLTLIFILFMGAHSILLVNFRYIIPILPLLFLILISMIYKKTKYLTFILTIVLVILFFTQYNLNTDDVGYYLTSNLEYRDYVKINQEAAIYLEENYKDELVLAPFPQVLYFTNPYLDYVNQSLNVPLAIPRPAIISRDYKEPIINFSEVEIIFYSPQSYASPYINEALETLNYTKIKEFSKNNKSIILYQVN
jgi:hypothetical protein